MAKMGTLLFLLAVAASQLDLSESSELKAFPLPCPISLYGVPFQTVTVNSKLGLLCFGNHTFEDCLNITSEGIVNGSLDVTAYPSNTTILSGSKLHQAVPNITNAWSCGVNFIVQHNSTTWLNFTLNSFGAQTVLQISATLYNISLTTTIDSNKTISQFNVKAGGPIYYKSLSGCRIPAHPYVSSSYEVIDMKNCTRVFCNASVLYTDNPCPPQDVCTVIGPKVIDFLNKVQTVNNRCLYSLMRPQLGSRFNILAGFRERHRLDVMFLDHLILQQDGGATIRLEQGGRVMAFGKPLAVTSVATSIHNMTISKDNTGVTVKMPAYNITVSFDGNTAHVTGPDEVQGLCVGNTTVTAEINYGNLSYSNSCKIQYNDTFDGTIDCNSTTQHCNILMQAPFTACHQAVKPLPFVSACTKTLCSYPAVDDLKCHFMHAYAKSCNLSAGIEVDDWSTNTNITCSAVPRAVCLDQYCSGHEFCGHTYSEPRCFCRALFASKYNSTNSTNALGESTVCKGESANLTLAGCLLEDKRIDYRLLHLNNKTCTGRMDNETHMVTFSFDTDNTCGTTVTMNNNSQIVYKNTITTSNSTFISRSDQATIDFSCYYDNYPDVNSTTFKIKAGSVVQQIISGAWNYTVIMNAYLDAERKRLINPNTEIRLNQKIWMELKTTGLDNKTIALVTDSCWATNTPSSNDTTRYNLIVNGCPNPKDQTVKVEGNGRNTFNYFSFNTFEFTGKNNEIYLHCKLSLCDKQNKSCPPVCGGARRRRSSQFNEMDANPAVITLTWRS